MHNCFSYDIIEWGKPFELREREIRDPIGNQVLIKVLASGLCHSDLHIQKGSFDLSGLASKKPESSQLL